LFVSAPHLTRNSPIIFVLHDVPSGVGCTSRRPPRLLVCIRVRWEDGSGNGKVLTAIAFVLLLLIINICSV
jgi:hypothetical protein